MHLDLGLYVCVFSHSTAIRLTLAVSVSYSWQLMYSYTSSSRLYLPFIGLISSIKSNSAMKGMQWWSGGGRLREDISALRQ